MGYDEYVDIIVLFFVGRSFIAAAFDRPAQAAGYVMF